MPDLPDLDPVQQRVLGCLLEKQVTVPASYPLTLNALRTACNQSSSRDPVMDLEDATVETTARALRDQGLLRIVWADTGRRVLKYHQRLDEVLDLSADERALITVLLLRGAQAPGELRSRTERLHSFADREQVEACLNRLAERLQPLVARLERRPGQQDHRWVHLLGPVEAGTGAGTGAGAGPGPTGSAAPAGSAGSPAPGAGTGAFPGEPEPDREQPLEHGAAIRDQRVRAGYAAIAQEYADRTATELDRLPFERWLLDRLVALAGTGPVMDAGCGPGTIAGYLARAGVDIRGMDLTPEMVDQARARHPGIRFDVGDLTRLIRPEQAHGWAAVVSWYSLIHLAGSEFPAAVAALARPLAPGGVLLLGLFGGRRVRRITSLAGHDLHLDYVHHEPAQVVAAVRAAGLDDIEWYLRGPITALEEKSERLYLLARRAQ